jgi:hypothetical protein
MPLDIDVAFDFRTDTKQGKDPDIHSKTLRRYHKLLWSKRLPCGELFCLSDQASRKYLHHRSSLGEFSLSSDTVIPTFRKTKLVKDRIPADELEIFRAMVYTMGGMMVFPANRIDNKWTINQARGCTRKIGDRFDLTLECIRRHYLGLESPIAPVLTRYASFFALFVNFRGYVDFFLLQDFVADVTETIKFHSPFNDFCESPIPSSVDEYRAYKRCVVALIEARNRRIQASAAGDAAGE